MTESRFPNAPERIRALPLDKRGFPVPWFVAWDKGEPVFPAMDGAKLGRAIKHSLCWVCGQPMGRFKVYVIGPMCVANRVSAEPPSHADCAHFAAVNCPFLANPRMGRVPQEKYGGCDAAGLMIPRNPGVTAVVTCEGPISPFSDGNGGVLFKVQPISKVEWFAEGREATRAEVEASFNSGLPILQKVAEEDGDGALAELARREAEARTYFPVAA